MTSRPDWFDGSAILDGANDLWGVVDASGLPASHRRSISTQKARSGLGWRVFFERLGDGSLPSRSLLAVN